VVSVPFSEFSHPWRERRTEMLGREDRAFTPILSWGMNQRGKGSMEQEKYEVLTTKEACEYLRISRPTFLKLVYTKQIRARKVGRDWRVLRSELRGLFEMKKLESQNKWMEQTDPENEAVDAIDQNILRILSLYERLPPLQLWYELGEDDIPKRPVTQKEIENRLKTLVARGFVERVRGAGVSGDLASPAYRLRTSDDVAGSGEEVLREVGL
jgi:excisionase family DNA binding protein